MCQRVLGGTPADGRHIAYTAPGTRWLARTSPVLRSGAKSFFAHQKNCKASVAVLSLGYSNSKPPQSVSFGAVFVY